MKETWWDYIDDWHIELEDYNLLKRNCDGPTGSQFGRERRVASRAITQVIKHECPESSGAEEVAVPGPSGMGERAVNWSATAISRNRGAPAANRLSDGLH